MRRLGQHELHSPLSPAEHEFKLAVCDLILRGIHPGPTKINCLLGRSHRRNEINGRESRWRREIMHVFGVRFIGGFRPGEMPS
jgi:hypothetical protein